MVVPTVHTTQQNSLIGSSSKIELFHCHNADIDTSVPIQFLPTRFSPQALLTHISISCISHFWEILQAYDIEDRVQQEKEHKNQGACQALGINRILSKVQKSFWSCTHVNSC